MAYDLAYLRNRVMDDKLDDDSIDPAIIDRFLNDTQRYIYNNYELPLMETIYEGQLPINNYRFSLPDDVSLVQSVVLVSPDGKQRNISDNYLSFREFNRIYPTPGNNTAGAPLAWTSYGGKFILSSPTDQEYTLAIYYLKKPVNMTADTSVPSLPDDWEEVLILGAYIRALERNEDFDLAGNVRTDFIDAIQAISKRAVKRQSSKPVIMGQPRTIPPRRRV